MRDAGGLCWRGAFLASALQCTAARLKHLRFDVRSLSSLSCIRTIAATTCCWCATSAKPRRRFSHASHSPPASCARGA